MYYTNNDFRLYHHGIKGQKWGVRRYQNSDGSLTDEGRKRYSSENLYNTLSKNYRKASLYNPELNKKTAKQLGRDLIPDEQRTEMKALWEKAMSTKADEDFAKEVKIDKLMSDTKLREQYSGDEDVMRAAILKDHPELKTGSDYASDFFVEASKMSESLLGEYAKEPIKIAYKNYSPRAYHLLENVITSSLLDVDFDGDKKK